MLHALNVSQAIPYPCLSLHHIINLPTYLPTSQEMTYWGFQPSAGTLSLIAQDMGNNVDRLDDAYHKVREMKDAYERAQAKG